MIKLLIGGSPCTYWSIAQKNNRETTAEGVGWELFKNWLVAKEKYHPDYFLYENNKSMAPAIREQITHRLGVEPIMINSALVSAQNRKRLYWTNIPWVQQPEDKGLVVRDILESGLSITEKAYTLKAQYAKSSAVNAVDGGHFPATMVAEPIRIGTIDNNAVNPKHDSQAYRVYSPNGKSITLVGNGGGIGAKTGLYAVPVKVGEINGGGQGNRVYSIDTKGCSVTANGGGLAGSSGGLYAIPANDVAMYQRPRGNNHGGIKYDKSTTLTANGSWQHNNFLIEKVARKTWPVYEVRDGKIFIKDKLYSTILSDGFYIIRKLTVLECKRLQTVPDEYMFPVSDTQAYKMLGNGWTVDVITHILSYMPGITTNPLEVLSMYDGMSCGHIALEKLGANIIKYYATEIDKYAIKTTQHNFPDTIQLGNAFQVREDGWSLSGENKRMVAV